MRAWELYEATNELGMERYDDEPDRPFNKRKPLISLRYIHQLKKIKAIQQKEDEQRRILMGLMYGMRDENEPTAIQKKQDQVDLLKKELELKKVKIEIHDLENRWVDDLHRLARSGINRAKKGK